MIFSAYILISLAICMSLFIWSGWGVSRGKNFGVLAVSLAIYIILCSWLAPSGVWIFFSLVSLLFAGLSGFFKNTPLSISATVITTLFLIISLFPPLPPGPPPPEPPIVTDTVTMVDPSGKEVSIPYSPMPRMPSTPAFSTAPSALILGVFYLIAITGIISSVIQNHYHFRSTHAGPTMR